MQVNQPRTSAGVWNLAPVDGREGGRNNLPFLRLSHPEGGRETLQEKEMLHNEKRGNRQKM
jgi:hypothetical protein